MVRFLFLAILLFASSVPAFAQRSGISPPDPFVLTEPPNAQAGAGNQDRNGNATRSTVINPGLKTLVLFTTGQSNWTNINPSFYSPTNGSVIDNANIYDGALYAINGALLGCMYQPGTFGPGNLAVRVADTLITNLKFDRVILMPIAIGGSTMTQWGDPTGLLYDRVNVAMKRLASRGITPATTGVTFALIYGQGEGDGATSQAAYSASLSNFLSKTTASGFSGRIFIPQETWNAGATSAAVRAAQAAAVGGSVFSGGDLDTLNATNRQADNTHFNDTGAPAAATIVYNAMHASGAPY